MLVICIWTEYVSSTDQISGYLCFLTALVRKGRAPQSTFHLVSNSKWLILRAQPLLDDILAIFPQLSGVLYAEAVIEHIFDLLQAKTRDLGIEEICTSTLALESHRTEKIEELTDKHPANATDSRIEPKSSTRRHALHHGQEG